MKRDNSPSRFEHLFAQRTPPRLWKAIITADAEAIIQIARDDFQVR